MSAATRRHTVLLFSTLQLFLNTIGVQSLSVSPHGIYSDVRIKISDQVPRQKCRLALDNLEALMTSVSAELYDVTGGRGRFGSFSIELPHSWNSEECLRSRDLFHQGQLVDDDDNPDFVVEGAHPIFGADPWTQQFGQCGVSGLGVRLPYPILLDEARLDTEDRVRTLQAWMRYRYGVFPEVGFPNDPRYPEFYQVGPQMRKNEGCNTTFVAQKSSETASNGTLAYVRQMALCTSSQEYDKFSPTKQNLLCNGKSALQTILSHADFPPESSGNKSSLLGIELSPPQFKYSLQKKTLSLILVLDASQKMSIDSRWARTRDALFRLVSHLPTGSELGIITVGGESGANVNIEPTMVRESNREGLHGRIPNRLLNDREACLSCGVSKAKELLNPDHLTSIIVVSASHEEIVQDHRAAPVFHIFFDQDPIDELLRNGTKAPGAEPSHARGVFRVPKTPRLLQSLSSIFLSVLKLAHGPHIECTFQRFFHFEANSITNDEDSFELVHGNSIGGTFTVEKELNTDLWVILTPSPGFEEDIEVFEVTSPSGRKYVFPHYDHGIVYFHFEPQNNEEGVWSFEARLHPIVTKTLGSMVSLEVFGQQASPENAVTVDFWIAPSGGGEVSTAILYAKVSQDDLPIQGANVVAFVYPPSVGSRPLKVKLEDAGSGYPDITRGDGIYSSYLTVQSPGFFSIVVRADYNNGKANLPKPYGNEKSRSLNCCGSKLPDYYNIPTSPFERVFSGQSFTNYYGGGLKSNEDVFPPSRITDLRLRGYVNSTLYAILEWTSPGDDFNIGTAFRYEMRCYTNEETLVSSQLFNKAISVHESLLPTPKVSGSEQTITVALPWANEVFYYAIVAMDESNNRAQVSNLVPVYVEEVKTTTQLEMTFKVVSRNSSDADLVSSKFEAALDNDTMIYVISGGITAFLLVLIAVFTIAMCRAKRRRALKERPPPPITSNEHHLTEANIYVVNNNSSDQPLSSVTTAATSVMPDLTSDHLSSSSAKGYDLWKMDNLIDSGYINTYYRGAASSSGGINYPSLQAFPNSSGNMGPMSLLSLNISHNPKVHPHQPMASSHSQTNLSALSSSHLPLQVFRNGSGSSGGTSGSRDQSPTYQNWSQANSAAARNQSSKEEKSKSGSDCTSSTECSEDSDRNSEPINELSKGSLAAPTPAPRTTLEKSSPTKSSLQSSIRSLSVERVKQVRHESLV